MPPPKAIGGACSTTPRWIVWNSKLHRQPNGVGKILLDEAHAALATAYIEPAISDAKRRPPNDTATNDQRALRNPQNQYEAVFAARAEVLLAQPTLETAQFQAVALITILAVAAMAKKRRADQQSAIRPNATIKA